MADAAHGLLTKYGLKNRPSEAQVRQWAQLVRRLERQGTSLEQAGLAAARETFPDFKTVVYAAEADTIEALLRAAEGK